MHEMEGQPLLVPDKYSAKAMVRCNPLLMDLIRTAAQRNARSVSAEIVIRVARSLQQEKKEEPA